ncbi:hypothetical protein ScPMuIL_007435 [Solemya velum]
MTKLMQWLAAVGLFMSIWLAIVLDMISLNIPDSKKEILHALPVYILIVFACYSLALIGYRVATFNDCVEESRELKEEIQEAKKELTEKGYKFD